MIITMITRSTVGCGALTKSTIRCTRITKNTTTSTTRTTTERHSERMLQAWIAPVSQEDASVGRPLSLRRRPPTIGRRSRCPTSADARQLIIYAKSYTTYAGRSVEQLRRIALRYRLDLDLDGQEFVDTLERWHATALKHRQICRLAAVCRLSEDIPSERRAIGCTFASLGYRPCSDSESRHRALGANRA